MFWILLCSFFIFSCSTFVTSERVLSDEEMQRYNLNGILHEAKICPNKFDDKLKGLVVTGPCEIVSCQIIEERTVCKAKLKE